MHLIATIPGGWNPSDEGIMYVEQSPGDIVFLSSADTELYLFSEKYKALYNEQSNKQDVPTLRMANLLWLKQEYTIDCYADDVLMHAKVIVANLLGGYNYYPYLVDVLLKLSEEQGIKVIFLPGNTSEKHVMELSTASQKIVKQIAAQFEGGMGSNYSNAIKIIFNAYFKGNFKLETHERIASMFAWSWQKGILQNIEKRDPARVIILAYRAHYFSENTAPLIQLQKELHDQKIASCIFFVDNLRKSYAQKELEQLIENRLLNAPEVCINTTSFSLKEIGGLRKEPFLFERLNIPVIQAIFASINKKTWQEGMFGLSPTDIAINVALPEVDGRIITRPLSFKKAKEKDALLDSDVSYYEPFEQGIQFVATFAKNWLRLREKKNEEKQIAIILPNYPTKDSRIANGVGLDTPASTVAFLAALKKAGYNLGGKIPETTQDLIHKITSKVTNNPDSVSFREVDIRLKMEDAKHYFSQIPAALLASITKQWGKPQNDPFFEDGCFLINGFCLGNIYVGIQPSRGYNLDPKSIYHSPDLPPTWAYLIFYFWVQTVFKADAIIHLGKHGNLEWLPGKSIALDNENCFPAHIFKPIPNFYPFIVNDPGEGTQAKRRMHSIIIDHLVPPITRAELYGDYISLEHLIDEYYEAMNMDPKRIALIKEKIQNQVEKSNLEEELSYENMDELLLKLDAYLCELKEAQIRGGLHILGQPLKGEKLADMLVSLHRLPQLGNAGLTQALANDLHLNINPIDCDFETACNFVVNHIPCRSYGKVVEQLEILALQQVNNTIANKAFSPNFPEMNQVLSFIQKNTLSLLNQTSDEIGNLLQGLNGRYVPSGSSGAPTRGRMDVLPTGKNFYSIDVRTIPTEISFQLGKKSAQLLINRYLQEEGEYPTVIGISVWGTSTMRTGGDDISQALALMGVEPAWQGINRRIIDFNILPLSLLNRPRIDVILRISGFFRDAFPDTISLFNAVVKKVAMLDEPLDMNPIKKRYLDEKKEWMSKGLDASIAEKRALYRVFGSKPGSYGVGIQKLIDEKNWTSEQDIAEVYMNWSSYAYDEKNVGHSVPDTFEKRISTIKLVVQNQDNREHDILDSDDYYQFHGGMMNAVKQASGETPQAYFGDHSQPNNPRIKSLKEELLKVYRSRAVNPKWINAMQEHGYKGAFEMSATLDYMFGYDATTNLVSDFMYENMAKAYLLDEKNSAFLEKENPWALQDIAERFLEAIQRKMWNADEAMKEKIVELYTKYEE